LAILIVIGWQGIVCMTIFSFRRRVVIAYILMGIWTGCVFAEGGGRISIPRPSKPMISAPFQATVPAASITVPSQTASPVSITTSGRAQAVIHEAAAPVVAAQVVWVKGVVQAISPDKKVRALQRRDFIYEHDTISSQAGGSGQIVFSDNTLFSISENSTIKVDQYRFTKSGKVSDEKYVVDVVKGGFRTVTGLISKAGPNNYKVNTPVATIGVRGTEIVGHVDVNGKGFFSVPQGAADFTNSAGTFALEKQKQNAYFTSKTIPAKYTDQPDESLFRVPQVQRVTASPELLKKSIVTSTVANQATGGPNGTNGGKSTGTGGSTSTGGGSSSGGSSGSSTSTESGGGSSSGGDSGGGSSDSGGGGSSGGGSTDSGSSSSDSGGSGGTSSSDSGGSSTSSSDSTTSSSTSTSDSTASSTGASSSGDKTEGVVGNFCIQ
jgi:hypothetical protein